MKKFKNYIFYIILLISIEFIIFSFVNYRINSEIKSYLNIITSENEIKTKSVINTYNLVSEAIFKQIVNKPEILELYTQAMNPDSTINLQTQKLLFNRLYDTYKQLTEMNIKQLHFHLPDNRSFLRFHRPEKFGDDLSSYRYSVRMANQNKMLYKGFEEGKIYNGFRYVFPLSLNGKHLGTVETSFSIEAIYSQLSELYDDKVGFILNKKMVLNTVFPDEHSNYSISNLNSNYVNEKAYVNNSKDSNLVISIEKHISKRISKLLDKQVSFSISTTYDDVNYIISFISIKNAENKPVAFLVYYTKDNTVFKLSEAKLNIILFAMVLIFVLFIIAMQFINKTKLVKEQNKKLKSNEEELLKINQDLINVNNTKDKFFSIISHDLRSPFNAILGFAELLKKDIEMFTNQEIKEFASHIYNVSFQTFNLLQNLLNWSSLQTGKMKPVFQETELSNLVNDILELSKATANKKSISITSKMDYSGTIIIDENMIKTALRNIISNSIKFTNNNGFININTKKNDNYVIITIEDNGVGISPINLEKIFKIDSKTSTQGTNGEKGSGLGLILCKELVEINHGSIEVESQEGIGTKFDIFLPTNNAVTILDED